MPRRRGTTSHSPGALTKSADAMMAVFIGPENSISVDRSATQMVAYVRKSDSNDLLALDRRARQWVAENTPNLTVAEVPVSTWFSPISIIATSADC